MWSAIGNFAHAVAAKTGLVYTEQPELNCAWPLKPCPDDATAVALNKEHKEQFSALLSDNTWELYTSWKDPDAATGGDMRLWEKPGIGRYHFMKATFSMRDMKAKNMADVIGTDDLALKQKYSADCTGFEIVKKYSDASTLQHVTFYAPPPGVPRDFSFVVGREDEANGSVTIWGCTVDAPETPEGSHMKIVRATCLYGWNLMQVGDHVLVTYITCFDPRGWTPAFLLAWLKSSAAKEFLRIRSVCYGHEVDQEKTSLADAGISEENIQADLEKKKKEEAAAAAETK